MKQDLGIHAGRKKDGDGDLHLLEPASGAGVTSLLKIEHFG